MLRKKQNNLHKILRQG